MRRGANATFACHADTARVAPVLAAPAVCTPGHLLRRAAPPPAALRLLGAAMQMRATATERARVLPLHPHAALRPAGIYRCLHGGQRWHTVAQGCIGGKSRASVSH